MGSDQTFRIKRNDRLPALQITARAQAGGTPMDAASAPYPRFIMRPSGAASPVLSATIGATITNASQGQLAYFWVASNTATAGAYQGEFELTYPGGPQTVPTTDYIPITINLDLG